MTMPHSDHRRRVKQEFRENGMEHFPDHKVLEMMLYYITPRRDTNPLAHSLIERFGSLSGVIDAPYELLLEMDGVGPEAATYLKALGGFTKRYFVDAYSSFQAIRTTDDAKEYMRYRFLSDMAERVLLVCTGVGGKVVYSRVIASGTLERVELVPAEVVKTCLRADAVRAILAHNHPGGFCNPSRRDVGTTLLLHDTLAQMDIELYDHIIVASDGVFSMREGGMLPG